MKTKLKKDFETYQKLLGMLHDTYDTLTSVYFATHYEKDDPDIYGKLVDEKYKHIDVLNKWYTDKEQND